MQILFAEVPFHWKVYNLLRQLRYWIRQWLIVLMMTFTALAFNLTRGRSHQQLRTKDTLLIYCPITSALSGETSGKKRGWGKEEKINKKQVNVGNRDQSNRNPHERQKSSRGPRRHMSANYIIFWFLFYLRWQVCHIHSPVVLLWPILNGCVARLQIRL